VSLQRFLDGDYHEERAQVREMLARPEFARVDPEIPRDEYREKVWEWARAMAAEGATTRGLPSRYGGEDNVGGSVTGFEELAHGDLSLVVKVGVQIGLFGGAILHLGTEPHHREHLEKVGTCELPGCFAMTESGHGSNVQSVRTTATYDPEAQEFVVDTPDDDAAKDYIGNAAVHGRLAAVFAQLVVGGESHGVHCLLVPLRGEDGEVLDGVRIEDDGHKLGLNGVDNGRIWFDGVRVPRGALLNRFADVTPEGEYTSPIENANRRFFTMLGTLIMGRVSVAGAALAATKSALAIAVRHGETRRQFGPPDGDEVVLMDYRTHQRRLLPALARTYGLHFTQLELVAELHRVFTGEEDEEEARRRLESWAAGVKALGTWHATETIQTCREACGGAGYLSVNRFAALKADTDVFTTFEGDNTVLLQLVAKSLLTDYKDQFGELDPLGTARFVAAQVVETIMERTAVREILSRIRDDLIPSGDDNENLLDREVQLALFAWREEHILSGAARRLRSGIEGGEDPFDVFIEVQDHVAAAARAHVERLVLEAFARAVERCEDEGDRELLDRLCHLHALSEIERDRAWFQEHGRLSSTRSKAVLRSVNELCAEIRPDALRLVDAFGIPDAVLAAPIALRPREAPAQAESPAPAAAPPA
jgi:acyl-CoA oxidase